MICPHCNADLDGGSIYQTFLDETGDHDEALRKAEMFGATETEGRWGRQIGVYSMVLDRTVAYQCPDCNGEWPR